MKKRMNQTGVSKSAFNEMLTRKKILRNYDLYLMILLPVLYIIVFQYIPMYGAQIAFKDFSPARGIWNSPWVGLKHFDRFFSSYVATRIITNTLIISAYSLIIGFVVPIILALSLNNMENIKFKKTIQSVTYAPYFISTVVMVGIIVQFLSPRVGVINQIIQLFGFNAVNFMGRPDLFSHVYVWTGIWQGMGWGTIIYLASLSSVDTTLYDAASVDGASKLQKTYYVDIPAILPTASIMLILGMGSIMSVGFEKVFLMQNPLNLRASEVISTYVYKTGLASSMPAYSFATAIGLFNSLISFILIVASNAFARKFGETSLW